MASENYGANQMAYDNGYRAGWEAAREKAAQSLDAVVAAHLAEQDPERTHGFCEDFGCTSLTEYAQAIRALKPEKEDK